MTLYIGNLSYEATENDLREVFEKYGAIRRIVLPVDRETGKRRGFAFVELVDETQEAAAIDDLDGATWLGRVLKVNKAKPKQAGGSQTLPSKGILVGKCCSLFLLCLDVRHRHRVPVLKLVVPHSQNQSQR